MTAELFRAAATLRARDCHGICQVIRVRGNANPGKTFTRRSEAAVKVTFAAKPLLCARFSAFALVAQLDRASDFESEGREFESLRARQIVHLQSGQRQICHNTRTDVQTLQRKNIAKKNAV